MSSRRGSADVEAAAAGSELYADGSVVECYSGAKLWRQFVTRGPTVLSLFLAAVTASWISVEGGAAGVAGGIFLLIVALVVVGLWRTGRTYCLVFRVADDVEGAWDEGRAGQEGEFAGGDGGEGGGLINSKDETAAYGTVGSE